MEVPEPTCRASSGNWPGFSVAWDPRTLGPFRPRVRSARVCAHSHSVRWIRRPGDHDNCYLDDRHDNCSGYNDHYDYDYDYAAHHDHPSTDCISRGASRRGECRNG